MFWLGVLTSLSHCILYFSDVRRCKSISLNHTRFELAALSDWHPGQYTLYFTAIPCTVLQSQYMYTRLHCNELDTKGWVSSPSLRLWPATTSFPWDAQRITRYKSILTWHHVKFFFNINTNSRLQWPMKALLLDTRKSYLYDKDSQQNTIIFPQWVTLN